MSKNLKYAAGNHLSDFEQIKSTSQDRMEYWSSRDLAEMLGYTNYRLFERVIKKAKLSCFNSGHTVNEHFVDSDEMVEIGSDTARPVKAVLMSRYACYLAIQNANPEKEIVAKGQTYFASQTRRQELGLNNVGSAEMAANLFCVIQAEEKLRRDNVVGKEAVDRIYHDVSTKVGQTIRALGGTLPDDFSPIESIAEVS